jgi:uncharacterized DUF497 family protein
MTELRFEWDSRKAESNETKHGVSFEEAKSAFWDEHGLLLEDPDHPSEEGRLILLGLTRALRLLVVVHTLRDKDVIRIISARKATRREAKQYESRLR